MYIISYRVHKYLFSYFTQPNQIAESALQRFNKTHSDAYLINSFDSGIPLVAPSMSVGEILLIGEPGR